MNITGHTRQLCLIGNPVAHSSSPAMHNTACRALGLDYIYTALPVEKEDISLAIRGLKAMHVRGFNITMPGKMIAASIADVLSPEAKLSGSVNTMVIENDTLYGYSTDGYGFMESLRQKGIDLTNQKLTLLGGGGAANAICVQAALDGAKEISIFRRKSASWDETLAFAERVNAETNAVVSLFDIHDTALLSEHILNSRALANATPIGMAPSDEQMPIEDPSVLHKDLAVFDAVYHPLETKLIKEAKARNLTTVSGLSMLLYQGAKAFEYFTGHEMPVEIVKKEVFSELLSS